MTDNEIINVAELCCEYNPQCARCPLNDYDTCDQCMGKLLKGCLDLINRQKAEIERLQEENNQFADIGKMYSEIKAEAIKEFADLVIKDICEKVNAPTPDESVIVEKCNQVIVKRLKEMAGDAE